MALLPVYRWAGLEDDLSRRQQWGLNALGLAAAILGAHALGYIDLTAFSASVLAGLPPTQRLAVGALAFLSTLAVALTVADRTLMDTKWVVAASVGGFVLVDLFYVHPHVFENLPSLFYWLAKPVWVGLPMLAVAWWLGANTDLAAGLRYTVAGLAGVVSLQLYYTVIPIPVVGGEAIQIGLVGNLTTGLRVHGLALLAALAVIVVAIEGRRRWYA